ncbi:ImmA/IrrE family metallo-endopeptidase [Paeniclostridium sordellii]|uniref:ImmA/IrrE family metallo-endopeptidase n=1 Tax=Paraclostridium sordellii TaxID=1505 RepID=UPI0012EDEDE4|nr:ImmA/IrrE family metallo-endopeptidase [Paeniclostridium sordellii]
MNLLRFLYLCVLLKSIYLEILTLLQQIINHYPLFLIVSTKTYIFLNRKKFTKYYCPLILIIIIYSSPATKEIALNHRNSQIQNVKTLLHEFAHAKLHTLEKRSNYFKQKR